VTNVAHGCPVGDGGGGVSVVVAVVVAVVVVFDDLVSVSLGGVEC